jgi:hypothetical protein
MRIPFLIGGLIGLLVAAAIDAFLSWDKIVGWFANREYLTQKDRDNAKYTIREYMKNGNYSVVQGVFNKRTNEVLDSVKYEAEDICDELKYGEPIRVY